MCHVLYNPVISHADNFHRYGKDQLIRTIITYALDISVTDVTYVCMK